MLETSEMLLRLILSAGLASLLGWEREKVGKPAGLRTNMMVAIGTTLLTLVSVDALQDGDPSRIAAGIVTGIGFLGAGTIFRAKNHVHGLTTAATVWSVAAVGIAVGTGYYSAAIASTIMMYAILKIAKLEK